MKKGFTLIEIIVAIALISIIGVSSFVGVKFINEKIRINRLEQITDKVVQAAQVYIESNKEASNQLYNNQNGVYIPIKFLVNEGLLNLDNTDIKESDYKDEYVITALSTESSNSTECQNIDTKASWDKDKVIYICTNLNSNGTTSSNLAIIDPDKTTNMNKATREKYYFVGGGVSNWIKLEGNDNLFRIIYVDTDDSLVLYAPYIESFGNIFNGVTMPISSIQVYSSNIICRDTNKNPEIYTQTDGLNGNYSSEVALVESTGETDVVVYDVIKTSKCTNSDGYALDSWMYHKETLNGNYYKITFGNSSIFDRNGIRKKIHIKACMKITDGTGDYSNPFILKNKCN